MQKPTTHEIDIVVLGHSRSGKTCIINRYTRDVFVDTGTPGGISLARAHVELDSHRIRVDIWDVP